MTFTEGEFTIRRAMPEDADRIDALMQEVHSGIANKETFICDDKAFVLRHIEKEGFILIAENRTLSMLSAVFIIRHPQMADDNLGKYLGLSGDDLLRITHMESAVVSENARGNHLEEKMMRLSEMLIPDKYDIFMGVASPYNIASIKAFQNNGYNLCREGIDYNGFMRNVYIKYRDK